MELRDKVAVVTGGSRGIGRAIVDAFCDLGITVAFCGRSQDELEVAKKEVESAAGPGRVIAVKCDVRRRADVSRFIEQVCKVCGRIDVLVHNAGVGRFGPLETLSEQDWQDVVDIDLNGSFHIFQEVVRRMLRNGAPPKGYIVTVGSLCHRLPVEGNAAYACAKAAQKVLADYLFEEFREKDILGTYLAIGSVNTRFSTRTPDTGWKIQPQEVAAAVVKMAELAFSSPNMCLSYAELRVRRPLKLPYKE